MALRHLLRVPPPFLPPAYPFSPSRFQPSRRLNGLTGSTSSLPARVEIPTLVRSHLFLHSRLAPGRPRQAEGHQRPTRLRRQAGLCLCSPSAVSSLSTKAGMGT